MGGASSKAKKEALEPEPEQKAAVRAPLCPHAKPVTAKHFRKTLRRRFPTMAPSADDSSSDEESGLGPVEKTGNKICCEVCGSDHNVWLCMHCGKLMCLEHDSRHACTHASKKCNLMMSCLDSHVYCCGCDKYLYPREVSGRDDDEEALGPHVAAWLQILGRYRQWWRAAGGARGLPGGGCHGLPNLGNTCFFSATVQSLVHSQPLVEALAPAPPAPAVATPPASPQSGSKRARGNRRQGGSCQGGASTPDSAADMAVDVKPIHRELQALASLYWSTDASPPRTPAAASFSKQTKALWNAVAEHALFGEYAVADMEDANTLLQDLLCGVEDTTVRDPFSVH